MSGTVLSLQCVSAQQSAWHVIGAQETLALSRPTSFIPQVFMEHRSELQIQATDQSPSHMFTFQKGSRQ